MSGKKRGERGYQERGYQGPGDLGPDFQTVFYLSNMIIFTEDSFSHKLQNKCKYCRYPSKLVVDAGQQCGYLSWKSQAGSPRGGQLSVCSGDPSSEAPKECGVGECTQQLRARTFFFFFLFFLLL